MLALGEDCSLSADDLAVFAVERHIDLGVLGDPVQIVLVKLRETVEVVETVEVIEVVEVVEIVKVVEIIKVTEIVEILLRNQFTDTFPVFAFDLV